MFTGARGGASIARAWLDRSDVELTLITNGYDDGPGALRHWLPGMPSPTRFCFLLAVLRDRSAAPDVWFERPLPIGADLRELGKAIGELESPAAPNLAGALARTLRALSAHLNNLALDGAPNLGGSTLAELGLAGSYLRHHRDFNRALARFSKRLGARGRLVNVTMGDGRFITALGDDGRVLGSSTGIDSALGGARASALFFTDAPLRPDQFVALEDLDDEHRRDVLSVLHSDSAISLEATYALRNADLIVYGPGSPFTSLLPSYKTRGVRRSIERGRARVRLFVANLRQASDALGWNDTELVDGMLAELDDPHNSRHLVTHVLADAYATHRACGVPEGDRAGHGAARRIDWLVEEVEDPKHPGVHAGTRVVERALSLLDAAPRR
jgi:2-phospho-L-lactate transferase CofD